MIGLRDLPWVDIHTCPRCGGNHGRMPFRRFQHPIRSQDPESRWTHWADCNVAGEPILIILELGRPVSTQEGKLGLVTIIREPA